MKFTALSVIFSLFIVGLCGAVEKDLPSVTPPADLPAAIDRKTTTTTTLATSTSSSEAPITPTVAPTAPPTPVPTSSSTEAPTQAPTTQAPTSTVAPPVTTTPAPGPIPAPGEGQYVVSKDNKTCILVQFAAQLNVTYTDEKQNVLHKLYNLPKTKENVFQEAEGDCGNTTQYILIKWSEANETNSLELTFNLNTTTNEFSLKKAVFNLSANVVPTSQNRTILYHVGSTFEAPKDKSYHCTRVQKLNLTDSEVSKTIVGDVYVSHVLVEAFHQGDKREFSTAVDCDAINTPDIVPIAVGIALIALVVVVLVAYLVGRRRAQARGYVSM